MTWLIRRPIEESVERKQSVCVCLNRICHDAYQGTRDGVIQTNDDEGGNQIES